MTYNDEICRYTGKVKHASEWEAEKTMKRRKAAGKLTRPVQVYLCWVCDCYHLGGIRVFREDLT
jgi:hypothetical protein